MALPVLNDAVHRHTLTRAHQHQVAQLQLIHGRLHFLPVHQHASTDGTQRLQRPYRIQRLALGAGFQPFAQQHQRDNGSRCLEIQMRLVPMATHLHVAQQQIHRQAIGRRRAQRHQHIHIAATRLDGTPGRAVKTPAQYKLHRRGQQQLHPTGGHPVHTQRQQQHGQHHRRGQQTTERQRPPWRPLGRRCIACHILLHRTRRVTRRLRSRGQCGKRHTLQHLHRGFFAGQIHAGIQHAGHFKQGFFNPAYASRTAHFLYLQFDGGGTHAIARRLHGGQQLRGSHAGVCFDKGLLAGQIHAGGMHAGHFEQGFFHTAHASRAADAVNRQLKRPSGRRNR